MYKLHIRDDSGETTVVPVTRDKITVGRQEGNTIRLTERNVSRVHARIVCKDSQVFVEDVSRYGTRINGLRIKERKVVEPDDVILIGDYELKVESDKQVIETLPSTPKAKPKKATKKKAAKPKKEAKQEPIEARMTAETTVEETIDVDSTSMINLNAIEKASRDLASKKSRVVADVPTLVAVNTELAGQEFRLGGTELVVGRTDDNDVVVDHRSISRNHARIVNEKGRVTVFDLDSANGLKINDEFYKQSVLRRGDVIELGHVRMRFVESGETFVYRQEDWKETKGSPVSTPVAKAPKGSNKIWIIALLFLVAAGGVVAVVVTGGDPQTTKKSSKTGLNAPKTSHHRETPTNKPEPTPTITTGTPAVKPPPVKAGANAGHAKRLAAAKAFFAQEKWDDARISCGSVLLEDGTNQEAKDCVAKAEREAKVQADYTKANEHFRSSDYPKAWQILEAMSVGVSDSVYKAKFNSLRAAVLPNYVNKLISSAKSALAKKRYGKAITLSDRALDIDPANTLARRVKGKAVKKRGADGSTDVVAKDGTKRPKDDTKRPKDDTKRPPPDGGEKMTWRDYYKKAAKAGAGKLAVYQEAAAKGFGLAYYYIGRTHMVNGRSGAAKKAFKTFLRKKPGHPKAESVRDFIAQLGG